jgi:hypothetical protein
MATRKAFSTVVKARGSASPRTRTTTPPSAISIGAGATPPAPMVTTAAGKAGAGDGGSSSTIAGTNAGIASLDGAEPFTASRQRARQRYGIADLAQTRVISLISHLAPKRPAEAFAAAKAIGDNELFAWALKSLARYMSTEQKTEVLASAKAMDDEGARMRTLESIAPYLAAEHLTEALAVARSIDSRWLRARALGSLVPYVPPIQYADLFTSLIEAASRLPRSEALLVMSESIRISAALGGVETIEVVYRAIRDTAQWYP